MTVEASVKTLGARGPGFGAGGAAVPEAVPTPLTLRVTSWSEVRGSPAPFITSFYGKPGIQAVSRSSEFCELL